MDGYRKRGKRGGRRNRQQQDEGKQNNEMETALDFDHQTEDVVQDKVLNTLPAFAFEKCEWYMSWTPEPHPGYCTLIETIQSQFSLLTIEEFALDSIRPLNLESGQSYVNENKLYNLFEHVTQLGALAYFNLKNGELLAARNYLRIALETVTQCIQGKIISEDYSESFGYVLGLVALYALQVEESLSVLYGRPLVGLFVEFKWVYSVLKSFDFQSQKVKAGIYGMKQFYWRILKIHLNDVSSVIRKAIKLDPGYFEWHACRQIVLSSTRRQQAHQLNYPWKEEKVAVITAVRLSPNHPRCMLAEISYLAELVHAKVSSSRTMKKRTKIYYESNIFQDTLSVIAFIKDKAIRISYLMPTSVLASTTIAEIFTVIIPQEFRDFGFAKTCLDRCIYYNPWSSEANYRMGEYFVNLGSPYAVAHSATYFNTAIIVDESHYPALCAFVKVLMQNIHENESFILELVQIHSTNRSLNSVELSNLQFLHGLVLFERRKHVDAINCFEKAFSLHQDSLNFLSLSSMHHRYCWPTYSGLTLEYIETELRKILGKVRDVGLRHFVQLLISKINEGIPKQRRG